MSTEIIKRTINRHGKKYHQVLKLNFTDGKYDYGEKTNKSEYCYMCVNNARNQVNCSDFHQYDPPCREAKEYVFLTLVEVDGAQFALLTPADEPEDEESATEVYIFRYEQDEEGGEMFSEVEDEALFQRVQAEAEKILVTDEEDDA